MPPVAATRIRCPLARPEPLAEHVGRLLEHPGRVEAEVLPVATPHDLHSDRRLAVQAGRRHGPGRPRRFIL